MRELIQELYASDTEMYIVPGIDTMLVQFYNRGTRSCRHYMISSFDLGNASMSMEKCIRSFLDDFLKSSGFNHT